MTCKQAFLFLFVAVAFVLKVTYAMSFDVPAHTNECFYEDLNVGDKLIVTYQVGDGQTQDIDFWITNPAGTTVSSSSQEKRGAFVTTAESEGRYTYCFANKQSSDDTEHVSFNVHVNEKNEVDDNNKVDPLKLEIEELADSILSVKAQQEYIVARERMHRNTAESTNARVKWWSVAQLILLATVCVWQVHYIKHFFEVKRAV